jgi:four helix bundle protein
MNQGGLKKFEQMEVWEDAQALALSVYIDFSKLRDFSFSDQIKRAAVSISNNIAEGAERSTPADFARFLDIAKGSAGEMRSMYNLAARLDYCSEDVMCTRCEQCLSISRQLGGFAKHLRRK